MTIPDRPDDIVRRLAGAEILRFPRASAPSSAAPAAVNDESERSSQPGASWEDAGNPGGSGHGGGSAGDDGERDRRLGFFQLTDLGNAERFAERQRGYLRYCAALGWLAWDGKRWKRDGAEKFVKLAEHQTVRAIQAEAAAIRNTSADYIVVAETPRKDAVWYSDKVKAWGRTSEGAQKLVSISKRAAAMLSIEAEQLDADPMCVNVQNGTLRIRKHEADPYVTLHPHNPDDFITKISPVSYDPDAICPQFDLFLDQVHPAIEGQPINAMQRFLHQWGGLSLTGDVGEQKMTFHYGKGRNGKGVWVNTVSYVAGDYAGSIAIESFLDSGKARAGGQATPDIADLPGVRFLTTSEPKKGATLDEGLVKLFTGGDPMKARHLNKDFFEFRPQAKLTMQGNYRPRISGTDEGIWGRIILVPWGQFIPPEKRDPRLFLKLQAEGSGILNRLLDGLGLWLDQGLMVPDKVKAATEAYRSDSDPLGRFLEACTRQALGEKVQSSDFHAVFSAWAKVNGETQWTPKGLGSALIERGFVSRKSSIIYWLDVRLIKTADDFIDPHGQPRHGGMADPGPDAADMEGDFEP
ncbi:DNA primase family protein [Lichenihabitans psoromatis]|uniref:DNA primase family protein n=1 Tax=Lichenihabitans psoromatis TaxID=2528642 RepID=UPI0010383875|nr:phage/plasmid primase, P4 family [Lichenihabitans psoromatis]